MKIFLKVLLWLVIILSLNIPMCALVSYCFEMPISAIFSAVWGLGCGFIATEIVS